MEVCGLTLAGFDPMTPTNAEGEGNGRKAQTPNSRTCDGEKLREGRKRKPNQARGLNDKTFDLE